MSKQFFDAYQEGNPNAQYADEGVFADGDSHMFFHKKESYQTWAPMLWKFFGSLGLNSQVIPEDTEAIGAASEQHFFATPAGM